MEICEFPSQKLPKPNAFQPGSDRETDGVGPAKRTYHSEDCSCRSTDRTEAHTTAGVDCVYLLAKK